MYKTIICVAGLPAAASLLAFDRLSPFVVDHLRGGAARAPEIPTNPNGITSAMFQSVYECLTHEKSLNQVRADAVAVDFTGNVHFVWDECD